MVGLEGAAEQLREHLHEGEDCPVCGGYFSLGTPLPLTQPQDELLRFWIAYREEKGTWPSMAEAGEALGGVSKVSIFNRLERLRANGYMLGPPSPGMPRAWAVLRRPPRRKTDPPEG